LPTLSPQQFARSLRLDSTDAEHRLWYYLRARRSTGMKFRRQHPIGPYVVDLVCLRARLIVEVDGGQHQERASIDQRRDQYLRSRGFLIMRFWNNDVLQRTAEVLEEIYKVTQARAAVPPLSRLRERGRG